MIKKLKTLCSGYILLVILTEKKWLEHFTKKNCKKVIKRKGNKLYGKQKGYSGYFSSWIDKKDMNKLV